MGEKDLFKDETLTEKFVKKGFWMYLFTFFIAPTGYIIRVIISNDLSVADVGIIYSIISFVSLISIYNDLGLTGSLRYFLPKYWINKQYNYFKTSIVLSLFAQIFTGVIITLLLFFGADFLAENYFHAEKAASILKIFCFYFLGINLYQVLSSIYSSFQDVFQDRLIYFIKMWSVVLFTLSFFFIGKGTIYSYALARVLGLFVAVIISSIIFYVKYKDTVIKKGKVVFDKKMLIEYRNYAFWAFLASNATILLGQIDQQMVVYFLGATKAGYYANYLSLINIVGMVSLPILLLLFPIAAEFISKKDYTKIRLMQNFFYKYFSVFAISFGLFLMVFGEEVAVILFGEKFIQSGGLLLYSGIFIVFNILLGINFAISGALGKVKENAKIIAIAAGVNFILNLILINYIGLVGAVISTIVGWIIMWKMSFDIINRNEKIIFDWKFFIKNSFLLAMLGSVLFIFGKDLFVLENSFRYVNLLYILFIFICYYLLIAIINYRELLVLKKQTLDIKNNNKGGKF